MSDIEHTHTHQIDSYFQHARESVSLAIDGETNVLILFIAVIVLLLFVCLARQTNCHRPRVQTRHVIRTDMGYNRYEQDRKKRDFYT